MMGRFSVSFYSNGLQQSPTSCFVCEIQATQSKNMDTKTLKLNTKQCFRFLCLWETQKDRKKILNVLKRLASRLLQQETATHSSILAWKIPWTEEPDGLQFLESQCWTLLSVGHYSRLWRYEQRSLFLKGAQFQTLLKASQQTG